MCASYPTGARFVGPRPNVNDSTVQDGARDHYTCIYHVLLAHGQAAAELRAAQPGATISMISDAAMLMPNTSSAADAAASERNLIWRLGAYFEPLVTGDWPPEMRAADPEARRLPAFSAEESALLRNSTAALGLNFYTTLLVSGRAFPCPRADYNGSDAFEEDQCLVMFCEGDPRCPPAPNPNLAWLHYRPDGLRSVLGWMSRRYPHTPLLVAENGVGLDGGSSGDPFSSGDLTIDTQDQEKIEILAGFWRQAWLAINEDGVDLRGIFLCVRMKGARGDPRPRTQVRASPPHRIRSLPYPTLPGGVFSTTWSGTAGTAPTLASST